MDEVALIDMKPNETGRVKDIVGGTQVKKRLYELGLNRGSEIKVIKNDIGPVILAISGNKLALGKGLASKIMIQR